MEFYAVERKKEFIPFATAWMELENKLVRADIERQIPYDFTYLWNLINKIN